MSETYRKALQAILDYQPEKERLPAGWNDDCEVCDNTGLCGMHEDQRKALFHRNETASAMQHHEMRAIARKALEACPIGKPTIDPHD